MVGGNSTEEEILFISTHGVLLTDDKRSYYKFDIGNPRSPNANIKIDNNKRHSINYGLVKNRKKLIQELMNGDQAVLLWLKSSKVTKSIFSLNGFTEAYKTAKGWCDSWDRNVKDKVTTPKSTTSKSTTSKSTSNSRAESLTGPQKNAVRSAKGYLRMSGFSRVGLIKQLSSDYGDGYEVADATVAVDSLKNDWNKEAVRSAKAYLRISGFSCKGLIKQLSSDHGDGYTKSQATYGARQAGAC